MTRDRRHLREQSIATTTIASMIRVVQGRHFGAVGAHEATNVLQRECQDGFGLIVFNARPTGEGQEFDRFVTALEQNQNIGELLFRCGEFDHHSDAVDRLFGAVLPAHPSLTQVSFSDCKMMPEYLELFASSLTNTGQCLQELGFQGTHINHQGATAFASLFRANAKITELVLIDCGIDSSGCNAILVALDGNTQSSELNLRRNRITEISTTALRALGNSNLRKLDLRMNPLTNEASQSLHTLVQGRQTFRVTL